MTFEDISLISRDPATSEATSPSGPDTVILAAGTRIGVHVITQLLGRGGMGAVYEADDTRLHRRVAIKIVHSTDASAAAYFLREARSAAGVVHANVVAIHEVSEFAGNSCLIMEYVPVGSVHQRLRDHTAMPWREATRVVRDGCRPCGRADSSRRQACQSLDDCGWICQAGGLRPRQARRSVW